MKPFDERNKKLQWQIVGDRIQNRVKPKICLDVEGGNIWSTNVISYKFHGGENQKWVQDFVDDAANHQ